MKLRVMLLILLVNTVYTSVAGTAAFDPAYVAVFFANPYPLSPVTSLRGLLMSLWSESQAVGHSADSYLQWQQEHLPVFTQRLLDMSTLVDVLCEQHAPDAEDRKSLVQLITTLEHRFYQLTDGAKEDEVGCVKIVFDRIKKKMEQTI